MNRIIAVLMISLAGSLLASCQSGGTTVAEGGIGGTGVSMGRVAQVGSVYVNGVHYNTDSTTFIVDGDTTNKSLSDISVGMVVRVTGSKDSQTATGVADSVSYDSLLIGPVDSVYDTTTSHLGIMGQAVHVNVDTVFEDNVNNPPVLITQLLPGDIVEVSGYPSTPGEILATRIALKSTTSLYKVTGTSGAVDPSNNTFPVGGLTIDPANILSSVPAEGSYVQVTGSIAPSGSNFTAESITPVEINALATDGESLSIEGIITSGLDAATHLFVVNGQSVDASLTPYSIDEMSLAAGRIVEVSGIMNGAVLLAESIELEATNMTREEIGSILNSNSVNLSAKTVTLLGMTVHITNSTIFESDRHDESTFMLANLEAGDYLEAKVYDNNGVLTASKLELDYAPYSYDASLEGTATELGYDFIEVLGVHIDTRDVSGYTFDPSARIKVKGDYNSSLQILFADSISEDD
jgi:hypothetical protein